MRLQATFHTSRRTQVLSSITGGLLGSRTRSSKMFPEEAERLVTPADLKRLHH
ncbi:hypothetical protein [Gordonia soli]|uniref:Uncharacterized protein n=1 Tax=Gordonia soli NBRC 108243 TaxID=1223545 RepID=M0QPB3_9ACTN|nr:hypothetical protein [Gordonia soli]GAC69282.1 hypothetical protein GS4_23_00790 [Gordonia soli NBRC 108243]